MLNSFWNQAYRKPSFILSRYIACFILAVSLYSSIFLIVIMTSLAVAEAHWWFDVTVVCMVVMFTSLFYVITAPRTTEHQLSQLRWEQESLDRT